jgi:ribose transport system permease protein
MSISTTERGSRMADQRHPVIRSVAGTMSSPYIWGWAGVALIFAVMLVVTPNAVSGPALVATLPYIGLLAFAAAGQAMVVMQRGIDFSVPGAIVLSGILCAALTRQGWDVGAAVAAALLAGLGIGLFNGAIVVYLRLTPLVATLASNGLYLGVALILGGGAPVAVSAPLVSFARGTVLGVSWIFILAVVLFAVLVVFLNRTSAGRRFAAVGSNPLAASAAGLAVARHTLLAYGAAGVCYSAAGILLASHIGDARLSMGGDYLMASIAAVVIGGMPLTGGRGSMVATFGGAVFMTLLTQFVLALGAPTGVQLLVQAVVLVAAIVLPNAAVIIRARSRSPQRS